mmetsp:Transcript_3799/g.9494  ORF Transcript_3799/g.9494 Transcript_3799/m.9494 type:complete len:220 (+) Transcript_3799:1098-1757(+)
MAAGGCPAIRPGGGACAPVGPGGSSGGAGWMRSGRCLPSMPSFWMSLYCSGISMSARRANCASMRGGSCRSGPAAISVKLTNWKLSKRRAGSASSNSRITSHGPSPTPTITMLSGYSLAMTMALMVACSCTDSWPRGMSEGRVTWPSATMSRMWYAHPAATTWRTAWWMAGAKLVGPASRTCGTSARYVPHTVSRPTQGVSPGWKENTRASWVRTSPKP